MAEALLLPLLLVVFVLLLVVGWLQLAKGANPAIATGTLMFFLAFLLVSLLRAA